MYAKLDNYDYEILMNGEIITGIKIRVDGHNDVTISDISTEINANDGNVYVDGIYGKMEDMSILKDVLYNETFLMIRITEEE